jgi:hypothetical protein
MLELRQEVAKIGIDLEGESVQLLRPVEGDSGHTTVDREAKMVPRLRQRRTRSKRAHRQESNAVPDWRSTCAGRRR